MPTAPVALFIFNRPEQTRRVLDAIRAYRPERLLVVADGPRSEADRALCLTTREVIETVDWPCEVLRDHSDVNLGCNRRLTSGLDWVFEQCENAIILEDDCLPHPSFFGYCAEMLKHYRHDTRIMHVGGSNFLPGPRRTQYSYYFSNQIYCWGWATWRRAWRLYMADLAAWPELRGTSWLRDAAGGADAAAFWRIILDGACSGGLTWDFTWVFSCWAQSGLATVPAVNLITNIGFGTDATNTKAYDAHLGSLPAREMPFPLHHPSYLVRDGATDRDAFRHTVPHDPYHMLRRRLAASLPERRRTQVSRLLTWMQARMAASRSG